MSHADKVEIQKQWDKDPCGAVTVKGEQQGTLGFYQEARRHRYEEYAPWFDDVMQFDEWRGKDVLEIGVGLGSDHFRFAKNGNRMTALDLSSEHLRQTERHLLLEGLTTTLTYGDAEAMPFDNESFDLVYAFGIPHHTPGTEQAVAEVHRVLRTGGTALIGLYHRDSYFFWLATLLKNGVLKGGLWRKGWRRLMADIEYRTNPESALPLVKVYSRGQVRRLFHQFHDVRLQVCHVYPAPLLRAMPRIRPLLERTLGWFGWYVVIRATK